MATAEEEMNIASNAALKARQEGLRSDANVLVKNIIAELARSGDEMPESTRDVLRIAAMMTLMLKMEN
ncbi:hypothetical protein [Paraburkholderia sp. HD33-4]|uniref:hypothetical protein n=1 Tax=Paraburkholderia sp. HD33-4 TaxID=2883242 RepID=UPI001F3BFE77|nr:hypothetical protein [Paraburkholderia sp. HD33-4]